MKNYLFNNLKLVFQDPRLTYLERSIYFSLTTFAGLRIIFPTLQEIGKRINCKDIHGLSIGLNKLKKLNLIGIKKRKQQSNIYYLPDLSRTDLEPETAEDNSKEKPDQTKRNLKRINESIKRFTVSEFAKLNNREQSPEDESFIESVLKIDKGKIEVYQKCLLLIYLIQVMKNQNVKNVQSYLRKSYQTRTYSDFHKEVFESKTKKCDNDKPERISKRIRALQTF